MSGDTISGTNFSITGASGVYGALKYSLVADTANTSGYWNLVVTNSATNITGAGIVYQSSNLGTTVNPIFDGGTLQISSAGLIASNFTITSNNGVIDQHGLGSNFSGVISNAVSGTVGSIAITNTGSGGYVNFSGSNTYTGSTSINSGATLALTGVGSIAASSGVTNNGIFDISTTNAGASITSLSGAGAVILGAKDLSLTNATGAFSGVISGAGGLIVSGGMETLSGNNSYTGSTQITGGTLKAGAANTFSSSSAVTVGVGAQLNLGSYNQTVSSLAGAGTTLGAATLTTGGGDNSTTYSGNFGDMINLVKTGSGTWTLGGTNSSLNRYQYLRHFPTSLGTALQILPEKVHCCNYGV